MTRWFLAGLALMALAAPASAQDAPRHRICIRAHDIEKSEPARDEKSILFVMRNRDRWRADFRSRCSSISFDGFSWVLNGNDEICEEQQTLKVNAIGGGVCVLGKFTALPR
jgi:hypothetical protein